MVLGCAVGGNAPEIEGLEVLGFGIFYQFDGEDAGGMELPALVALGALEVVASLVVVEDEAGGDNGGGL